MIETTDTLLDNMSRQLKPMITNCPSEPFMVGIHSGGAWVADALHQRLALNTQLGSLDITFYRDDFSRIGLHPQVNPSVLPFSLDSETVILVDDVLHTGRTIRAAMNELFDYGRPAKIILAVMIDRPGRELPIEAKVCGQTLDISPTQHIKITGPDPIQISVVEAEKKS